MCSIVRSLCASLAACSPEVFSSSEPRESLEASVTGWRPVRKDPAKKNADFHLLLSKVHF